MAIPINQAINAYSQAIKDVAGGGSSDKVSNRSEFADMVKGKVGAAIAENKQAERLSIAAVAGKADLTEVVTAVAEAELTVKTAVAIKDKVITAYKEILRMPI